MPESNLLILLKKSFNKKITYLRGLGGVILFASSYLQKQDQLGNVKCFNIYITIIILVLFFPFNDFFNQIIKEKEIGLSQLNSYTPRQIKSAKFWKYSTIIIVILTLSCLLIPGTIQTIRNIKSDKQICQENRKKMGLIIASFKPLKDDNDEFSSTLYGDLNSDLQFVDTINLQKITKFIPDDKNYLTTIKQTFEESCNGRGLIIFGNSNNQNSFNCRIYSYNFMNFKAQVFSKTSDKAIIYIQNPNLLNFNIDYEANMVSKFIYGLLYSKQEDYQKSNESIKYALRLNKNNGNTQFISMCHLFIGNNLLKENKIQLALKEYTIGISKDPNNPYLHYNIAAINSNKGDITYAFKEYEAAHKINDTLENPLKHLKTLTQSSFVNVKPIKRAYKTKKNVSNDTLNHDSTVIVPQNWEEQCYTKIENNKYGVINNKGATIIKFEYDEIISYPYKNADCFIVRLNNRYGAIIHSHNNIGYHLSYIKVEYSEVYRVKEQVQSCVDNGHLD